MILTIFKYHNISRKKISENAIKVLYRLNKSGYEAYLVGGSVRDLILGKKPKDFDITTNATPVQLKKIFKNSRLIGRRFQIAHIMFRSEIIEVSTFRGNVKNSLRNIVNYSTKKTKNGMLLRDNTFGNIEEDAQRRDITINTLYYSMTDFTIKDYVGGVRDLQKKIIRLIGDPETRYREDPVRMLRVIRFSVSLKMRIEEKTKRPIVKLSNLLYKVPSARLFNESIKLFHTGYGYSIYKQLRRFSLLIPLFPFLSSCIKKKIIYPIELLTMQALRKTDFYIHKKIKVEPAFLFSVLLWYFQVKKTLEIKKEKKFSYFKSFSISTNNVLDYAAIQLSMPKKMILFIKEIWILQINMFKFPKKFSQNTIDKKIFYPAYDLMLLRNKIEKNSDLKDYSYLWMTSYLKK